MAWGQYSQDISLGGTASMYFTGGCPPFSWRGSNVDFIDGDGNTIPFSARKSMNSMSVRSTDECEGSVTVSDRCNHSLSRSASITGDVGTVVGPSTLEPGETGAFYHDLGAGATYDGTLEMVQQSGTGAILMMPAGASGAYTAKWTASCGREASMTVTAIESGACTGGSCYTNILGTKSPGDVVCVCGQWVRLGATVLGSNLCWTKATGPIFWFAGGGRWVQCSAQYSPWLSYTVL